MPVRSFLYRLHWFRKIPASSVYGERLRGGADDRKTVFMDSVAFLFCGIRQVNGRRDPSGNQRHEPVYGCHLYGFDLARPSGLYSSRLDEDRPGHMVRMACRVDCGHGAFRVLLSEGLAEHGRLSCRVPT